MYSKQWIMFGAISGFFGVLFGAFGAHSLKEVLTEKYLSIYQTAVQYQLIHALALILLGVWTAQNPEVDSRLTGFAFTIGILLFSGSLYVLSLTRVSYLGAITPLGGVSFLVGWITFAFLAWKV